MRDHFLSFVILTFVCTPIVNAEDRIDLNADELNRIDKILKPATQFNKAEKYEIRSGGSGTYNGNYDANSYSHNLSTLSDEEEANFKVGNGLFRRLWVASPASTAASDGLGPYFDERACQSCHIKDGRGSVEKARLHSSLIVRLNREDANAIHGQQLQRRAIAGLSAEVDIKTSYEVSEVALNGGQIVELRQPVYTITDPRTGARIYEGDDVSVRMANPIYGVGLLEAIHPADIIANQDPDDSDGDGISGRISW